jgi:hypothetical protein
MELLRQADPVPTPPDSAQIAADYERFEALLAREPQNLPTPDRSPVQPPVQHRRPVAAVLAIACCALVIAAVVVGFVVWPKHHDEAQPAPEAPRVNISLSVDGKPVGPGASLVMAAGRRYTMGVQVAVAPGAHFTSFQLVVAGPGFGIEAGRPTRNYQSVLTVQHPQDHFTATGSWTAQPVGSSRAPWVEAVYSTTDANGTMAIGRTVVNLQVR